VRAGLRDPVLEGQAIFRAVLEAMAYPGRIVDIPGPFEVPPPLDPAAAGVGLALLDLDTPLWLDPAAATAEVIEYVQFHCGAPIVKAPADARFALIADPEGLPWLEAFDNGTDEYPDRSATLILQVEALSAGRGRRLSGPGIAGEARLDVTGASDRLWAEWRANHARFPRGVDLILSAGTVAAALPRSVRVED
jgi:alpha-D-ribose 1-methylphosphonate 5-triphosphate synthase subunit PhnH